MELDLVRVQSQFETVFQFVLRLCWPGIWPQLRNGKLFLFPKKRIWLSSNPSRITIRLGNIGNQSMQKFFPTHKLHISALGVGKRGSKLWPYVRIIHLEWLKSTIGKLELLLKNLAKLRARNLNRQQKTFRWRLFSPSTAQDRGMKNKYAPSSRTLGMSELTHSTYVTSNMLCTRYLQGVNIDATPDPPSLSLIFARGRPKV